jgi:hypothetical protein
LDDIQFISTTVPKMTMNIHKYIWDLFYTFCLCENLFSIFLDVCVICFWRWFVCSHLLHHKLPSQHEHWPLWPDLLVLVSSFV